MKRQQRIEQYFGSAAPWRKPSIPGKKTSFLDLPAPVRRRVYCAAGVVAQSSEQGWCRMTMNKGSLVERGCLVEPDDGDAPLEEYCYRCSEAYDPPRLVGDLPGVSCRCARFPTSLFLCCRAVYEELTRLFYSRTRFQIAYTAAGRLTALEHLGRTALRSLVDLTIFINVVGCTGGRECNVDHTLACHPVCKLGGHDAVLGRHPRWNRYEKTMLCDLDRLCRHLSTRLEPGRLKLAFVCECMDYGLADKLLASLARLPTLSSCTITLSREFHAKLRQRAEETRLRLLGLPESRVVGSFPLRRLPRELQLEVLRGTGLKAPVHLDYPPYLSTSVTQSCARTCAAGNLLYEGGVYKDRRADDLAVQCCCHSSRHTQSGWTCGHWHFPTSLVLVDKQMCYDTRTILYRENVWALRSTQLCDMLRYHGQDDGHADGAHGDLANFLGNVRHLNLHISCKLTSQSPPTLDDDSDLAISKLGESCMPAVLSLAVLLPHPEHDGIPLPDHVSASPWRAHLLAMERLREVLQGRALHAFSIYVHRLHHDYDILGEMEGVDCPQPGNASLDVVMGRLRGLVVGQTGTGAGAAEVHLFSSGWWWENPPYWLEECSVCGDLASLLFI
jgi:hypothetical protein